MSEHHVQPDTYTAPSAVAIDHAANDKELARQERLKRGVKVAVMGPPHSGKSVLIESLMSHFDADLNATMLSGCPDGEGLWLQKYYDNPEVAALRHKGGFTTEFVEFATASVRNFENPLALVDIGGRVSDENREIAAGATHAIILAGSLDKVSEWQSFADELGIPVVAKLHSHYTGDHDTVLKTGETVVASTHYLERGTGDKERPSIGHVAELLTRLANENHAYWQQVAEQKLQADEVELVPREIAKGLGRVEKTKTLPGGAEVKAIEFEPEDAKALYTVMQGVVEGKTVKIDGFVKGWEFTAMTFAALSNGANEVMQNSPNGYVAVRSLEVGTPLASGIQFETRTRADGAMFIDVLLDGPIDPSVMETLVVPAISGSNVIISGKIPHWLRASIGLTYANACDEVAVFTPGEGNTIVWSRNEERIGVNYE
ncbi:MAG: CRISPR-associated protein Csx3 [Candidatus Saccharimonas sp.]